MNAVAPVFCGIATKLDLGQRWSTLQGQSPWNPASRRPHNEHHHSEKADWQQRCSNYFVVVGTARACRASAVGVAVRSRRLLRKDLDIRSCAGTPAHHCRPTSADAHMLSRRCADGLVVRLEGTVVKHLHSWGPKGPCCPCGRLRREPERPGERLLHRPLVLVGYGEAVFALDAPCERWPA
eukprot:6071930-Prymnesium_polylepis.1